MSALWDFNPSALTGMASALNDTALAMRNIQGGMTSFSSAITGMWNGSITYTRTEQDWTAQYYGTWRENPYLPEGYQEDVENRHKEWAESNARAEALLMEHLTPKEKECYKKNRYLLVSVKDRLYRLPEHHGGGIDLITRRGKVIRHYCVSVPGVPAADDLLARKILLEAKEDYILTNSNITYGGYVEDD